MRGRLFVCVLAALTAASGCGGSDEDSTDDTSDVSGAGGSVDMLPGAGGADPTTGGMGGDAGGTAVDDPQPDLGVGDGSDVITIGDSYMNLVVMGVQQSLEAISGQTYRKYAVPGTEMGDNAIPDQYRGARLENPDILTVVMDGGGNDALAEPDCRDSPGDACIATIDNAMAVAGVLFEEMAADGVQDVVYFYYPHLPGENTNLNPALDFFKPLLRASCEEAPVDCHFVDPTAAFEGHEAEYNIGDNVHPNQTGMDVIAGLVWDAMVDNGVRR